MTFNLQNLIKESFICGYDSQAYGFLKFPNTSIRN